MKKGSRMKVDLRLILVGVWICPTIVFAQALPSQKDEAIERQRINDALNSLPGLTVQTNQQKASNASAIDSVKEQGARNAAENSGSARISDFANLSRQGTIPQAQQRPQSNKSGTDLLIFVSLSMPAAMLKSYTEQAVRFDATLVLRGFVDDKASATREALANINQAGAAWVINPEPFKTFRITKVPAIVLASSDLGSVTEDGCAQPDKYSVIYGDIPVIAALDKFHILGKTDIAKDAKSRLTADRLSGRR